MIFGSKIVTCHYTLSMVWKGGSIFVVVVLTMSLQRDSGGSPPFDIKIFDA